jgi:hypothetical protein
MISFVLDEGTSTSAWGQQTGWGSAGIPAEAHPRLKSRLLVVGGAPPAQGKAALGQAAADQPYSLFALLGRCGRLVDFCSSGPCWVRSGMEVSRSFVRELELAARKPVVLRVLEGCHREVELA